MSPRDRRRHSIVGKPRSDSHVEPRSRKVRHSSTSHFLRTFAALCEPLFEVESHLSSSDLCVSGGDRGGDRGRTPGSGVLRVSFPSRLCVRTVSPCSQGRRTETVGTAHPTQPPRFDPRSSACICGSPVSVSSVPSVAKTPNGVPSQQRCSLPSLRAIRGQALKRACRIWGCEKEAHPYPSFPWVWAGLPKRKNAVRRGPKR